MTKRLPKDVPDVLKRFERKFRESYFRMYETEAINKDNDDEIIVARCILLLTARQFQPLSGYGHLLLAELENFI